MEQDIISTIQTLGFPIFCVLGLGLFIYKIIIMDKTDSKKREESLTEANVKVSESLTKLAETMHQSNEVSKSISETNRMLVDKIEGKLDGINNDIGKVLERLSK